VKQVGLVASSKIVDATEMIGVGDRTSLVYHETSVGVCDHAIIIQKCAPCLDAHTRVGHTLPQHSNTPCLIVREWFKQGCSMKSTPKDPALA